MITSHDARQVRRLAAGVAIVTALLTALPATAGRAAGSAEQRVVVTFAAGTALQARADAMAGNGTVIDEIDFPSGSGPRRRAGAAAGPSLAVMNVTPGERATLRRDDRIVAVEDDVRVHADRLASDPGFALATGLRLVGVETAWDITVGDDDVVIAVIDSGVDVDNPDFAGKMLPGHDFVNDDDDPDDDNGHGTAVASIAAAHANNDSGVAGVCWTCRILPIKALNSAGSGYLSDAARGIAWAVEHGADIVNLSLSGTSRLHAMDVALEAAEAADVVVVASAGNSSTTTEHWPAAHRLAVAVAAVNGTARADYSNYGGWIDIAAPGCNPADKVGAGIRDFCGTSSSAPLTAGVAALVKSADPTLSAPQIRDALTSTADSIGSGLGAGRVNAREAVSSAVSHSPATEPQPQDVPGTGTPADPPGEQPVPTDGPATKSPAAFDDITGNVHAENITRLAAAGITSGCDGASYCPTGTVTRGQIATFLDRALDLPPATVTFADVPAGHTHAAGIAAVAAAGIAHGCGPDTFCPGATLTRAQMATLLDRALDLPDGTARFTDVPDGHPYGGSIAALAAAGITSGCTVEEFCPGNSVSRAQMASFLVRALEL